MSNVLDRVRIADLKPEALDTALVHVLCTLTDQMKPKARDRALATLTAYADGMDNYNRIGRVVPIRAPAALSAHELELKARADAIRYLIGRAF